MATFNIQDRHVRNYAITSSILYLFLSIFYFSPILLQGKTAFPLASIAIVSLWLCPWQMTAALACSALGDLAGAFGNFILQMGAFAAAHIFLISFFMKRYKEKVEKDRKLTDKAKGYTLLIILMSVTIAGFAFSEIIPNAPEGIIRIGTGIYTVLICTMLVLALLQRSSLYALGALLFVFSDFILAWNKFTAPIENAGLLIMIPYYLGQWLIYIRSTSFRVGPEMRLMRF
jgi:uncharacterized membrane protein YhhN